jgi:hypothetical protein
MKTNTSPFKKIFILKYFILGLSIAFLIHATGSCRKDPITPDDGVDVSKINAGAKLVETAFTSGDVNSIKNVLTGDATALYGTDLLQINRNHLIKLGEAFKTKELIVYSGMYAEYNYTKEGVIFTFAMARQEDGSWKLMRF